MEDYQAEIGFATVTDEEKRYELREKANAGTLSFAELDDNREHLDRQDWRSTLDLIVSNHEKDRNQRDGKIPQIQKEWDRNRTNMKGVFNRRGKFDSMVEPIQGPKRLSYGDAIMEDIRKRWANDELKWLPNKEKRQYPDMETAEILKAKAEFLAYKKYPVKSGKPHNPPDPEKKATDKQQTGSIDWGRMH
jgi:hypothetical protein